MLQICNKKSLTTTNFQKSIFSLSNESWCCCVFRLNLSRSHPLKKKREYVEEDENRLVASKVVSCERERGRHRAEIGTRRYKYEKISIIATWLWNSSRPLGRETEWEWERVRACVRACMRMYVRVCVWERDTHFYHSAVNNTSEISFSTVADSLKNHFSSPQNQRELSRFNYFYFVCCRRTLY